MPLGRPDEYTEEKGAAICTRISQGESVRSICIDEDMPNASTVFRWIAVHPSFSKQYALAKECGAEKMADEIMAIADQDGADVQRDKLRVDTRKWLLSKLQPKKYGDRVTNEVTGPDGGPVQITHIERVIIDPKGNNTPNS